MDEMAAVQLEDGDTLVYSGGVATRLPQEAAASSFLRRQFYENQTGIYPTEYKVLVKPKPAEEVSKGGIIMPVSKTDSEKFAQTEGTIVAQSPLAHSYVDDSAWAAVGASKPKPGDRILYAKYAGAWVKGKDGQEYLLIQDKDICATIDS